MFVEILFIHFTKYAPAAAGSGWRLTVPGASHYKSRQVLSLPELCVAVFCCVLQCSSFQQLHILQFHPPAAAGVSPALPSNQVQQRGEVRGGNIITTI